MVDQEYKYSSAIQFTKLYGYVFAALMMVFFILSTLNIYFPVFPARDYICEDSLVDCLKSELGILISILTVLLIANSYPNIGLADDGLLVEFLWKKLFIRWEEIEEIKTYHLFSMRLWIIKSNRLPLFYYLYGLFTFRMSRCFIISHRMKDHKILLKKIMNNMSKERIYNK